MIKDVVSLPSKEKIVLTIIKKDGQVVQKQIKESNNGRNNQ